MKQMTVQEAAAALGVPARTIRHRLNRGLMRGECAGGHMWLITPKEVERWRDVGRLAPGRKRKAPEQERKARDGATGH